PPSALQLRVRDAGDTDVRALGRGARALDHSRDRGEAVRQEQLDALAERRPQVLDQLAAVLADQRPDEYAGHALVLDLRGERLVARGLRVIRLEAGDLDAELESGVPEVRRDAETV